MASVLKRSAPAEAGAIPAERKSCRRSLLHDKAETCAAVREPRGPALVPSRRQRAHGARASGVARSLSLGEEVGQGSHSIVYKCRRSSGDSAYIAVKHFSSRAARDAATSPRAQDEFALARRLLTHDYIVRVLSLDLAKGCLAMEFVDGGSLEDVMVREGPLREERVIRVLCQVLEALALLHAHGCTHRDVKPANVLVETHTDTFKLSDWIGSEAEDLSLALGKPVGTPVFMAPEVAGCPHRHCFESDTVYTCTHSHAQRTHALAFALLSQQS
jgi:serine/threonine protein kinase